MDENYDPDTVEDVSEEKVEITEENEIVSEDVISEETTVVEETEAVSDEVSEETQE